MPDPVPLDARDARVGAVRRLPAGQGRLRHRGHHVGPGLPAGSRRAGVSPGPPCWPVTATGPGKSQAVGLEHTDAPNSDYALQLVRQGYVVLAPDLRCFGERLDWNPEDHYACDTNLVHAVMAGWNPLAQNVWDLQRCLDVLAEHPLVDPARIGMVGLSYGGTVTLFTAACDSGWPPPWSAGTSPRGR